jgi:hypothetical protein
MMPTDEKPSKNETEYFARLDAELMKQRRAALDTERTKRERATHLNKCPKDGSDLTEREHHHVKVEECPECGGIWLDKGELDMIEEFDRRGSGFMGSLLGFKR